MHSALHDKVLDIEEGLMRLSEVHRERYFVILFPPHVIVYAYGYVFSARSFRMLDYCAA